MRTKSAAAAIIAATAMMAQTGCDTGGRHQDEAEARSSAAGRSASPTASASPSVRYTAEQLKRALIEPPAGATNVKSGSGTADTVLARYLGPSASPVVTDTPDCAAPGLAGGRAAGPAPAAFLTFTAGETFSDVLLAATEDAKAKQLATQAMPKACRSTKAHAGGTTITATVVSDDPFPIGEGGRIRETDQMSGGTRIRVWDIAFTGPGYIAFCDVGGLNVARADAERLARQLYRKASATLR
jgi:hypothetical protein